MWKRLTTILRQVCGDFAYPYPYPYAYCDKIFFVEYFKEHVVRCFILDRSCHQWGCR